MKKVHKSRRSSKAPTQKRKPKVQAGPILELFGNMNEDPVAMLRQVMQQAMGADSELFSPEGPVDLFAEYLENCARRDLDEDEKNELSTELVAELAGLKVDSNGGDREAREKIQAIYGLLDNAIESHSIDPVDMMMTGKIFSDAGLAVPDNLRQAMAEALQ